MKYTKPTDIERPAKIVDRLAELKPEVLAKELRAIEEAIAIKEHQAIEQVPVSIFATKLSPAEALVKWLKENHGLGYTEIARLLGRDVRGIWLTYQNARKKYSAPLKPETQQYVPVSIFRDRSRSILEHLVLYLKDEQGLSLTTISALLKKHQNTIRTVYQRGRRKQK